MKDAKSRPGRGLGENLRESITLMLREYAEALMIAIGIALLLRFFVIAVYRIPTPSMFPNLVVGDFVLAYRLPYSFNFAFDEKSLRLPERGELVVFRCPQTADTSCIKRVIALPGDRVQLIKKRLLINGKIAAYGRADQKILQDFPGRDHFATVYESLGSSSRQILVGQSDEKENFGPFIVPPHQVFVLSDNRDASEDSRDWGAVPVTQLEGRVLGVWLSLNWHQAWAGGHLPSLRWNRIFSRVH